MDIRPPKNWRQPVSKLSRPAIPRPEVKKSDPPEAPRPLAELELPPIENKAKKAGPRGRKKWPFMAGGFFVVLVAFLAGSYWWFTEQLKPVDPNDRNRVGFEVNEGASFSDITKALKEKGLIRSELAVDIYARLEGKRENVKAGMCRLDKTLSVKDILDKLSAGCHDLKKITFFPGATIEKPLYKPEHAQIEQTMYVKYVLEQAGYSEAEITAALAKQYSSPIFADKPAGTTLEGYIFGETYHVPTDASVESVLEMVFGQFDKIIQKNDLVAKFKAQGLTLYQGITLASIVQRELNCEDKPTPERKSRCHGYQQTIAQVFLTRLKKGGTLGSDVTFIYAADMMKVAPTPELDSPYNTRIHPGLPPGPIAAPGELALQAVANPTNTDYLFFLAGDDGLIYFARTNQEHEANIAAHCQVLCQL